MQRQQPQDPSINSLIILDGFLVDRIITHLVVARWIVGDVINPVDSNSRNISKSKDLKPSSDLILVDGDIGKMDSAIKVSDAAIKHFDRIDLLVNCAGIYIPKPFTDYTPADFELMISTNVAGYFFITQIVVVLLRVYCPRGHNI